jgi:hypothetical protein
MSTPARAARPLPTGDELLDALRHFFRERAGAGGAADADAEQALLQLQKLATLGQLNCLPY